ncbi:hypothetical protein L3Q82_022241 [Scortum barcoo]|uniref:Uncharacterized protein n=1 Tax=Scortum barcoo TaxID=214431 RepID=A0ACB8X0R1_9TELE|nr:hypothetical protein L3Q82_022241 [Scortum barcoo]
MSRLSLLQYAGRGKKSPIIGGHQHLKDFSRRDADVSDVSHFPSGFLLYIELQSFSFCFAVVECPDPNVMENGNVSPPQEKYFVDNETTYECYSGYTLRGSSRRVCLPNGKWSGSTPICSRHTTDDCADPGIPAGASRAGNIFRIDDKVTYTCNGNLFLVGSSMTSFTVVPNYEIVFFSSEVFEIGNILDFIDGRINVSTIVEGLENFQTGNRNADGTNLNLVFMTFLELMAVIKYKVAVEDFKEHHHVLIIFTDGAYNMGGSPEHTVARMKNIVGERETQSREQYLDIFIFGIGAEIFDDHLQPLTAGTRGRHYFRMRDIQSLSDTFKEMIDEQDVKGLCGLHKDDDFNTRKKYPWLASIFVQSAGASQKCLGSLVTPQFVLTAAQCFPFGVLPEHIRVNIDDGHSKVKRVKKLIIHPNYNVSAKVDQGIKEFYDYDVALVQLQADVNISTSVRPICIPCTQETNNALHLVGVTTCKEQEQYLLQNLIERLSFLTKTGNTVEKKQVSAKLGQTRDECIKHALQAPGITTTNPKDVVTDNFLCTGGLNPLTDHIACTGDGGSAVFKNYEHRTVQHKVTNDLFCRLHWSAGEPKICAGMVV